MITEKNNVFYCDCGFSFQRGRSGAHDCADGLRNKLVEAEARCATLAAELSAVETIHNDAVFITDEHYEQCPPEVQKMIRSLAVLQIPECHAFLAEVRARAIDSLVDIKTKQLADMHPDTHAFGATAMSIRSQINELQVFAAQLRKGVQS